MADNLTAEQRRYCMSRVKGRDTGPELAVRAALRARSLCFTTCAGDLPGRPDIVLRSARVAVFIDGDFWHGYRFPAWCDQLSPFWQRKISTNRARDLRNHRRLRRMGWRVVRLWQHTIDDDLQGALSRILEAVHTSGSERPARPRPLRAHTSARKVLIQA